MSEYVTSLDIGKYDVKSIGRNVTGSANDIKRISFRTKSYNLENGYIDVEGNSHEVEYNGKSYIIGEQGEQKSNETSKTNLLHQIAGYTAITQLLEPNTKDNVVNVVLACPLSVLKIQEAKEEYKNFIKGTGAIHINVDGADYSFTVKEIMIKAEGSGVVVTRPEKFIGKTVIVIDFGGLNMGVSIYVNGVCKQSDRFIEEHGANALTLLVQDQLTAMNNGNIVSYAQAEQALEKGHTVKNGEIQTESIDRINKAKEIFFNKALEIIKTHGYGIDNFDESVFIGGTTQKLRKIILDRFKNAVIPENPQWTTAEGLYKIACAKYCK
ncbi:ParM/StbA family protein [Clostridium sp. K25]|uniref:ParM/StbA family protein n=1 Tax=Clostridium sp. K25 TaxID=1443109 RepID=UPI0004D7D4D7|nr:ParM/StbA family protein [Clostridium sp. K25]KEI06181.1 putative plasmid segregation protein ParM [Clostridium sp. K25]